MTTAAATVKKAAYGRSKSPPLAVKKQLRIEALPQTLLKVLLHPSPRGGSSFPADFKDIVVLLLPLGEGWDGASMLGWGLQLDGAHPWQLCRSCDFIAQG